MPALLAVATAWFAESDWAFTPLPGRNAIELAVKTDVGQWSFFCEARDDEARLIVYSLLPLVAPPERRAEVSELVSRVNFRLTLGNFELDLGDGEVRFRTSIDVSGDRLSGALVRNLVVANIDTMSRYLRPLLRVAQGYATVAEALADAG
jgi:hypothetical protein